MVFQFGFLNINVNILFFKEFCKKIFILNFIMKWFSIKIFLDVLLYKVSILFRIDVNNKKREYLLQYLL